MPKSSKWGVLSADSFATIAKAGTPFTWPIAHFYNEVASINSGLDAFTSGDVRDIVCYNDGAYKYLLMCVHPQNEGTPVVWVRTERSPVKRTIWKRLSRSPVAVDTIRISYNRSKLWKPEDDNMMASAFTTLSFHHVIDLLNIIHNIPNTYVMSDSMWYTGVVIGMLHGGFGKLWLNSPPPDWVKTVPYLFGSYAPRAMQHVERQFAIRHPSTRKISLREPEAWENESIPLSQPPSSKQDDREGVGVYSNPTDPMGKTAHIGSTPTLSQHLPEPRLMQWPNLNAAIPATTADPKRNGSDQPRNPQIRVRPTTGIDPSDGLASKPFESSYDPHHRSVSQSRNHVSDQTDETRPTHPASASSTPTRPTRIATKEGSTGTDEVTPTLPGVVITPPSAGAFGQGPRAGPSSANAHPSPHETPNLTGRIVRLDSTAMAIGGYSSVWRGILLSPTSDDPDRALQVAIKVLRARASYADEDMLKQKLHKHLQVEMRIWAQLSHENVVRLLGYTDEPEGPGLVSMLYPHGNVLSFLAKNPSPNREIICVDVALGLQYLHEHDPPIIHGDLKATNVLISKEGRASICDFGLSIILDGGPTGHTSSDFGGSLRFMAPELLEESTKTVQTDMYAYACTCFQILFDEKPYHEITQDAHLMHAILNHQPPFEPPNQGVPFPSFLEVLKRCWDHNRWSRPSLKLIIDAIQHYLNDTYRPNLGIPGIGRHIRFMSQTDERQRMESISAFSTPTLTRMSPKGGFTGIDEARPILQGVVITTHSAEAVGRDPQATPSLTNSQPSPTETPNLTGRIVRLGLTPLAVGRYSSVWRGSFLSTSSDDPPQALEVAVKVLRASYTNEDRVKWKLRKRLHVEMRVWAQLRHENVVTLLGYAEEPEGPGLVSVLYPHGSVLSFLAKNPSVNREVICADVALGLQYLHEHDPPIIHGNLKGAKVLIDAEGRASICDFGLSIILDGGPTGHTSSTFGGSLRFLPPELLEESTRTVQTDLYTYACTCIQILFDQEPYHQLSKEAHLMRAIFSHQPPFEPLNEEVTFPPFLRILKHCWDHDRWSRPPLNLVIDTIQRCLYHTYRTNVVVHQVIGRRVRFMGLPGIEQANLISVTDAGLRIVVNSSTSFHQVPIYQRYRWELMDRPNLEDSEVDSDVSWFHGADHRYSPFTASSSRSGRFASSLETPIYVSIWKEYSAKFRFPYSSMVSLESYHKATS